VKIITINLDERVLKVINLIVSKKEDVCSRSELIRRLIDYSLPRFLGLQSVYEKISEGIIELPKFKEPKYEKMTLAELRKEFANIPDYKFINEEMVLIKCQQ